MGGGGREADKLRGEVRMGVERVGGEGGKGCGGT